MMINEIIESCHVKETQWYDFPLILKQVNMMLAYEGRSNFNVKKSIASARIQKHMQEFEQAKIHNNMMTRDIVYLILTSCFYELLQGAVLGFGIGKKEVKNRALYDISPEAHGKLQEWIAANDGATVDKIRKKELAFIETYT